MTPERFQLVEELYHSALEMAASERSRFLAESCGEDRELLNYVESLIGAQTEGRLQNIVASTAALESTETLVGRRVGAYEVQSKIGSGGMGDVYLAVRADESYIKKVAIKFVKSGWLSSTIQERFRAERQILANLDHPYIARLLDGGTTSDGRPYLVMEYVDGLSIIEFADRNHLDLVQRVELFCRICEAVQYAHQNLIVHRDLKPANIVITHEGKPKLLDFGIAKLLDPNAGGLETQPHGWRMLTPDYASPEQFSGDSVTTASDVYSLGAVLYLLLTGKPAFETSGKTPAETERIVSEQEPERPSLRNPALRGRLGRDLDTVVLKAMRKNPAERYGGVTGLAADLEAALAGLPLKACDYTFFERSLRLARRHRVVVTAGVIVAISLLAGTAISLAFAARAEREQRIAEVERHKAEVRATEAEQARELARKEHDTAERERLRAVSQTRIAEERLTEFTALADSTISDLSDTLERMPGATQDRRKIVADTLRFLDKARAGNPGNLALLRTVATGYLKMARLLGGIGRPNLGDTAGSNQSLARCEALVSELLQQYPGDLPLQETWVATQIMQADVFFYGGRREDGIATVRKALTTAGRWRRANPNGITSVVAEASLHYQLANYATPNGPIDPLQESQAAIDSLAPLYQRYPENETIAKALSDAWMTLQQGLHHKRDPRTAEAGVKAVTIREQLLRRHPDDILLQRALFDQYEELGYVALFAGKREPARDYFTRAVPLAEKLSAADPANQGARSDLARILAASGVTICGEVWGHSVAPAFTCQAGPEAIAESIRILRRAASEYETIVRAHPTAFDRKDLANTHEALGRSLRATGDIAGADASFQRSLKLAEDLLTEFPNNEGYRFQFMRSAQAILPVSARLWGSDRAADFARKVVERSATYTHDVMQRRYFPTLWAAQGDMWEQQNNHDRACDSYHKAAEAWSRIPDADKAPGWVTSETAALQSKIGQCR